MREAMRGGGTRSIGEREGGVICPLPCLSPAGVDVWEGLDSLAFFGVISGGSSIISPSNLAPLCEGENAQLVEGSGWGAQLVEGCGLEGALPAWGCVILFFFIIRSIDLE